MIKIICVGKLKENYLSDGIKDYLFRISKYHKIELIELNDSNIDNERDLIMKKINLKDYIITLDIEGENISSVDFANKIDKIFLFNSNITFVIGGSCGLHPDIKKISNYSLSFSRMTFPHGLFRLILLEQIYRCFKILNNESYHK